MNYGIGEVDIINLVGYFYGKIEKMDINSNSHIEHVEPVKQIEPIKPVEPVRYVEEEKLVKKEDKVDDFGFPDTKKEEENVFVGGTEFNYIPRLVDKTIPLPIDKNGSYYKKVKDLIKNHMELSTQEMDYNKLHFAKDHLEAAVYYLRNIEK